MTANVSLELKDALPRYVPMEAMHLDFANAGDLLTLAMQTPRPREAQVSARTLDSL